MSKTTQTLLNNSNNRQLSLNLYRNLLRKCNNIDANPKYKAYFVTPPSLRYQLPTFFLPSVSFTQNLKVLYRLYAKYDYPSQNELNNCLSDGYFVLRNLNLASTYHKKQVEKESTNIDVKSIIQDLETKKPSSTTTVSSEHQSSNNTNIPEDITDIINSLQSENTKSSSKDSSSNNNEVENILDKTKESNTTPSPPSTSSSSSSTVEFEKKLQVNEIITPKPLVNLNNNNNNSNNENNNSKNDNRSNFWVVESNEVKPGTLLVSHPSLDMHFKRSVVLITHQVNENHYGYIINQPLPTSSVIGVLQEQFDNAPQLKNHTYSKNLVQHFRFSAKRPLSPFTKTPWYCGGPSSIEHNSFIVKGLSGLPNTQIIHPFSALPGSTLVRDGIYLGGNFKEIGDKIKSKEIHPESVMMMVGCSVWKPGELRKLIDQGAWFQADCTNDQIFKLGKDEKFWSDALQSMGGDYRDLINS